MQKDSLVIIPTFNEIENIENIIKAVFKLEKAFHILIVDDNSPDGTAIIVKELQKTFNDRLFLEVREEKSGLGTAYIHGFKWALKHNYKFIFEMDADFSHNPSDLIRLYNECAHKGADVAIGSRYIKGVNVVNWPLGRILLSYGASIYVRLITGMKVYDPTAGFICYKSEVIQNIKLDSIQFVGYAFQIEMKFRAWLKKYKIKEIPIIFKDRVKGTSKMNRKIISEAVFGVMSMKCKSLFSKDF
ncbi:polyprenol monophosphomannose synthase [Abyssalbus ytuae]|uniref:Polyprenol monophosphomannose synthase n=1 Tax=Abyssalbus ytuae TaxID=2926907 RepID=A0A9E7D0R6_9FLAO|nr:polyprenol monophosphomannose synthase [Abyssalbus ytuae]UOB16298.1 polyprenol monophosphomannose synthase [Abyssalbus ytuae]